jgi:hypothetical protein
MSAPSKDLLAPLAVDEAPPEPKAKANASEPPPANHGPPICSPGPDEFDWDNDDAVVVKPRPGVAVYQNLRGDVVIRVQNIDDLFDEDNFAFLSDEALRPVIDALNSYATARRRK